ncbi:MAG: ribonuclease P protein component [Planctomycetota bacterium]|nr:ribonuclease P protein component [Planctomycetota bacterium]
MEEAAVPPARGRRLRKHQRLRANRDFQRVYEAKQAWHGPHVVIFFLDNGLPIARIGLSVGRKHGNAVRRNRIKRALREAYQKFEHGLPAGYDFVLVPRRRETLSTTEQLGADLEKLARRLKRAGTG